MSWVSDFSSVRLELQAHSEQSTHGAVAWNPEEREGKPEGNDGKDGPVRSAFSVLSPSATAWVASYHTRE